MLTCPGFHQHFRIHFRMSRVKRRLITLNGDEPVMSSDLFHTYHSAKPVWSILVTHKEQTFPVYAKPWHFIWHFTLLLLLHLYRGMRRAWQTLVQQRSSQLCAADLGSKMLPRSQVWMEGGGAVLQLEMAVLLLHMWQSCCFMLDQMLS